MSVTGLCQVCESAPARHGCRYCGRQVCRDHWDDALGACTVCAEAAGGGHGGDPSAGDGPSDGDDPSGEGDPSQGFQID